MQLSHEILSMAVQEATWGKSVCGEKKTFKFLPAARAIEYPQKETVT